MCKAAQCWAQRTTQNLISQQNVPSTIPRQFYNLQISLAQLSPPSTTFPIISQKLKNPPSSNSPFLRNMQSCTVLGAINDSISYCSSITFCQGPTAGPAGKTTDVKNQRTGPEYQFAPGNAHSAPGATAGNRKRPGKIGGN